MTPWNGKTPCTIERGDDPGPFEAVEIIDERGRWFAYRSSSTGKAYRQVLVEPSETERTSNAAQAASVAEKETRNLRLRVIERESLRAAAERLGLTEEERLFASQVKVLKERLFLS